MMSLHAEKTLCIFTPTYNRAYCLANLFQSLLKQTSHDFCWLIVDDGSTDSTKKLIQDFIDSAPPFTISYFYQENGGKQRAHNTGVEHCDNELFVCVDSDDICVPDAVESILCLWDSFKHDRNIAGIISLCGPSELTPYGGFMPESYSQLTMWQLSYKLGHKGDVSLVYRTEILKRFPFVLNENEKFIAETFVYHQIDQEYELATLNKVTIIAKYLSDGYTTNVRRITKENPINYMTLKRMFIEYSDTYYLKFRHSILYLVGCILSHTPNGVKNAPYPLIATLAYPFAWLLCKTVYK